MSRYTVVLWLILVSYLYVYVGKVFGDHEVSALEAMNAVVTAEAARRFPDIWQMAACSGVETDGAAVLQFLNARLKANDRTGGITVADNRIVLHGGRDDTDDRWIFFEDGKLLLCVVAKGGLPDAQDGCVIAWLETFETVMYTDGSIINTIAYRRDGRRYSHSGAVYLRSVS